MSRPSHLNAKKMNAATVRVREEEAHWLTHKSTFIEKLQINSPFVFEDSGEFEGAREIFPWVFEQEGHGDKHLHGCTYGQANHAFEQTAAHPKHK